MVEQHFKLRKKHVIQPFINIIDGTAFTQVLQNYTPVFLWITYNRKLSERNLLFLPFSRKKNL